MTKRTGRPTEYNQGIIDKTREYIALYTGETPSDLVKGKIISHVGLAKYINRSREVMYNWARQEENKIFSDMLCQISEIQEEILLNGGLHGAYSPTICKLMLSKHGYHDSVANPASVINIKIDRDAELGAIDSVKTGIDDKSGES